MSEDTSLAKITQATALLEKAKTLEEVIEVHDQASAVEAYTRAKGADKAHSLALEVKLRSERKAGGFLNGMNERGELRGNRFSGSKLQPLGIEKTESSRWQKMARIPDSDFESYIASATKATQANLLALATSRFEGPTNSGGIPKANLVPSSDLAFLELFSGSGVLSKRFEKAGWEVEEIDLLNGKDVMKWEPNRRYAIIHSGPPCQEYSGIRHKDYDTTWDADVTLWRRTEDLVKKIRPRFWTIENVKFAQWIHGKAPYHYGSFFFWGWFPFEKMPKIPWTTSLKGIHTDRSTGARWEEDRTPAQRAEYPPALVDAYFEIANSEIRLEAVESQP